MDGLLCNALAMLNKCVAGEPDFTEGRELRTSQTP